MLYLVIAVIIIALIAKSRSSNNQTDSDADIEKQNILLSACEGIFNILLPLIVNRLIMRGGLLSDIMVRKL